MKGAEIIVKVLQEQKVNTVFGYPGGTILSLLDALRSKRRIKLYTNCHEQFCAHAAEGYAREAEMQHDKTLRKHFLAQSADEWRHRANVKKLLGDMLGI